MTVFFCKLADLEVEIHAQEAQTAAYFSDYRIDTATPKITLRLTDSQIEAEAVSGREPRYYLEFLALCRAFCREAYIYNVFLLHAAVIEVDGCGYAFFAPSGTGKSTHIVLWRRLLGERCRIVNGDKPFVRYIDGAYYAYGSPWCGKERWQRNVRVPLRALCRLTRGEQDSISRLSKEDCVPYIFSQIYLPPTADGAARVMEHIDGLLCQAPVFLLACTPNEAAAKVAYTAMSTISKESTSYETET